MLLQLPGAAVGRLREGMLIGYDNKRMKGLWPTKDMCEGYKYALTPNLAPLEVFAQVVAQLTFTVIHVPGSDPWCSQAVSGFALLKLQTSSAKLCHAT